MRPGGKNSPFEKDGTPKKAKKQIGNFDKGTPRYNPYGKKATATPENMAPGKP